MLQKLGREGSLQVGRSLHVYITVSSFACCRYGKRCRYAHGREELRPILRSNQYKTKICKAYHDSGSCSYGIRCTFIHQMNATDRNHYNLIPPISPTSSNSSFQSSHLAPPPPQQHDQIYTKYHHPQQHREPDLNFNMFISKNIMEDIVGLSSYEPERYWSLLFMRHDSVWATFHAFLLNAQMYKDKLYKFIVNKSLYLNYAITYAIMMLLINCRVVTICSFAWFSLWKLAWFTC